MRCLQFDSFHFFWFSDEISFLATTIIIIIRKRKLVLANYAKRLRYKNIVNLDRGY